MMKMKLLAALLALTLLTGCSSGLVVNVNDGTMNPNTEQTEFEMPGEFLDGKILIRNYDEPKASGKDDICSSENGSAGFKSPMMLMPYEAVAVIV